jgi:Domain of unknown function (DUF4156)
MKLRVLATLLAVLLVQACTTPITSQGNTVRIVENSTEHDCSFLSTVTGFDTLGANAGRESENAMNEARNRAAQAGANAIRILHMQTTFQGTTVTAEALRCQFE